MRWCGAVLLLWLGSAHGQESRIVFAEAGEAIAGDCAGELWLINPDGEGLRQLTGGSGAKCSPAWSPDGDRIAFVRCGPGSEPCDIRLIDDDGSHDERLQVDPPPGVNGVAWSPDGLEIAFTSRSGEAGGLWVTPAEGATVQQLVDGPCGSPSWSPDGQRIAYDFGFPFSEVWTIHADGTNPVRLLARALGPAWSPDGRRLAMTLFGIDSAPIGIIDPADPQFDYLSETDQLGSVSSGAAWSPDGRRLVYQTAAGAGASLWIINADGTDNRRLTDGQQPSWSPVLEVATVLPRTAWGAAKLDAR